MCRKNLTREGRDINAVAEKQQATIRPQPGPQEMFLSTPADLAVYGGAAGGGKTYALLMEPLRHIHNPRFGAVIFRRTSPQIRNEGGLWDESNLLYSLPSIGGQPKESTLEWKFPSDRKNVFPKIKFAHMEYEKNRHDWQGSQIPFIGFDQLEHFTWKQFIYMLSRNRSMCGVKPYIRGTANPDPDHWLREFLAWWINEDTGFANLDVAGVIRWFTIISNEVRWADTREKLIKEYGCRHQLITDMTLHSVCPICGAPIIIPKSCTFIPSSVYDNKILLNKDPSYLASLKALPLVDRERLLNGNWNIREAAGMFFQRSWFEIVPAAPAGCDLVRNWDMAATDESEGGHPAYTSGVLMGKARDGFYYVKDVIRFRGSAGKVLTKIKNTASQDGEQVTIGLEQDPGQAGKAQVQMYARELAGHRVRIKVPRESKGNRAKPMSAQAEAGNIKVVYNIGWNKPYLDELENFDGLNGFMDQVDASSGAFYLLTQKPRAGTWGSRT